MSLKKIPSLGIFLAMTGGALTPLWAGTCALCREVLRLGGSAGLIKGYYWSIILLVTMPLVILTVGLRYAWRRYH